MLSMALELEYPIVCACGFFVENWVLSIFKMESSISPATCEFPIRQVFVQATDIQKRENAQLQIN